MTERTVTVVNRLGLHARAAARGTELRVGADGGDEREALAAVCGLIERGFGEEE